MKIAHVAQGACTAATGNQDTRLPELAQSTVGLGHDVTIDRAGDSSVAAFAGYLADRWRPGPPDVVHAHDATAGLAALAAARDHATPVVLTLDCQDAIAQPWQRDGHAPGGSRAEAAIGRNVSLVIAPCTDQAQRLSRLGVPRMSVKVIPGGIDTTQFTPDRSAARRDGLARLVTTMPLADTRGLAALTHAMTRVPDAELLIVGGPPASRLRDSNTYAQISKAAARLGVADRVIFTGHVDRTDMPALLRSAELMVNAAASEAHGTAPVEAMACGTPVLSCASGCYGDAVADRATGVFLTAERPGPLAKQIRDLLASPMLLQGYAIAAADRAWNRYSWERVAGETVAAYESARRPADVCEDGEEVCA